MSVILNDTAWPQSLVDLITDFYKSGSEMQGVYNSILAYCFPAPVGYVVAPYPHGGKRFGATEFEVFYIFASLMIKRPVMYVEVENDSTLLDRADTRSLADQNVRRRLADLAPACPVPTFYGISIIGIKMRTYRVDVASRQVTPGRDEWTLDVRTQSAFDELRTMVLDIANSLETA